MQADGPIHVASRHCSWINTWWVGSSKHDQSDFDVPLETLKVKLRDIKPGEENESKHHLADLAHTGKHVLVVDDINDTGATLDHICRDWQTSFSNPRHWRYLFNNSVKFAMLIDNKSSKFMYNIDYYGEQIDKSVEDVWIEFPWEVWWESHVTSS